MNKNLNESFENFFSSPAYGVVGASTNRSKFGNKVLRVYLQKNLKVYPINPHEKVIEGLQSLTDIESLPNEVKSISIITPPAVTEKIVDQAIRKGIKNIWIQPGAASLKAIQNCHANKINVIANGPCILVTLGFHETEV